MHRFGPIIVCLLVTLFYRHANASFNGAPQKACITMTPDPAKHGAGPQSSSPPYVIQVNKAYYAKGMKVKVDVKACGADGKIGGILLEAREKGEEIGKEKPLGQFTLIPQKTRYVDCTSMRAETAKSAVTHSEFLASTKMLSFEWQPYPNAGSGKLDTNGNIYFVATIAKSQAMYWTGVKSIELQKMTAGTKYPEPNNAKCPEDQKTETKTDMTMNDNVTMKNNTATTAKPDGKDNDKGSASNVISNVALLVLSVSAKLYFL